MSDDGAAMTTPVHSVSVPRLESHRSAAGPPRRFAYTRFAGFCLGVLGASIGEANPGEVRRIAWTLTILIAGSMLAVGEWGVSTWRARFAVGASPELLAERRVLRRLNRLQVALLLAAVAAFIAVLFIPVAPPARYAIWLVLLAGMKGATRLAAQVVVGARQRRHVL